MAIIKRCFCCDVRVGSLVVAFWSMIMGLASLIQTLRALILYYDTMRVPDTVLAYWIVMIAVFIGFEITAIILVVGIFQNRKALFVPFIIGQIIVLAVFVAMVVILIVTLSSSRDSIFNFNFLTLIYLEYGDNAFTIYRAVYWTTMGLLVAGVIVELACLICVVSQYQELKAGRGSGLPPLQATASVVMVPLQSYSNQGVVTEEKSGTQTHQEEQAAAAPPSEEDGKETAKGGKKATEAGPSGYKPPSPKADHSSSSESDSDPSD